MFLISDEIRTKACFEINCFENANIFLKRKNKLKVFIYTYISAKNAFVYGVPSPQHLTINTLKKYKII